VLGADEDNRIAGEVLVELQPDVAFAVDVSVPSGPTRGAVDGVTAFDVAPLDRVLRDMGVRSITRVHDPLPPAEVRGTMAVAEPGPLGATFRIRFDPARSLDEVVDTLAARDEVAEAEPNRWREASVVPNDTQYPQQWGLPHINCPDAWDRTTGSPNIVVAVVDSGVDLDHPELQSLVVPGQDLVDLGQNPPPPMAGWVWEGDFVGVDNDPQDEVGHGTHVAGTIACTSNDARGVAGVTWNCGLMPVRVLARARRLSDNRVSGFGSAADIAAGIRWAADHGARIINLSLGGYVDTAVERNAVAYAVSRGCLVVAAMGNDNTNTPSFPAAYPDVMAVGAVNSTNQRAPFSNMGPHIDVAAPGVGVLSTYWDNTYASASGTSMASPHVAGVAALILSCNSSLPANQVAQILRDTARPLRDNPADPVPNDNYGFGLIDAKAAIDRACPQRPPSIPIFSCPSVRVTTCPSIRFLCGPSDFICPSLPVFCPSVRTVCPSVRIICPSEQICPSETACPSETVRCPSENLRCPSLAGCPSEQICPSETACPSETVRCPSLGPCPSLAGCPSNFCGRPGPRTFGATGEPQTYDPYGYDPYSTWYGGGV
jgi:subtilisin family serine protease